ncbi:MAG: hypothetical protein ACYC91_15425 [Solirubrobacteraceae bacterium]
MSSWKEATCAGSLVCSILSRHRLASWAGVITSALARNGDSAKPHNATPPSRLQNHPRG